MNSARFGGGGLGQRRDALQHGGKGRGARFDLGPPLGQQLGAERGDRLGKIAGGLDQRGRAGLGLDRGGKPCQPGIDG